MRVRASEIKALREKIAEEQNGLCGLCNQELQGDAVLDHCHKKGHIRAVLHRSCNSALGSVENAMVRRGVKNKDAFAKGVGVYLERHSQDQTNLQHPSYKPKGKK